MIKAVLFDLDDTLLSINLTAFVVSYTSGLSRVLADASRTNPALIFGALTRCFLALEAPGRDDGLSNRELWDRTFFDATGIPLDDPAIADLMNAFERDVVPGYRDGLVYARPKEGVAQVLTAVKHMGLTCALATNPCFSMECDRIRMGWAGVYPSDFALVSTLDNSRFAKPSADYYREFCGCLGVPPECCLMVGNDIKRDFPKPDCGLRTAYVGHARPSRAVWRGSLARLSVELPALIDQLNRADARRHPS